jgi:serine/threonine protein phosphatase 1
MFLILINSKVNTYYLKTLVIGDIHGCYNEMIDLIEKAGIDANDRIIALGDIIDRGPDSLSVLNFFMSRKNINSLLGNHEEKHIKVFTGKTNASPSQLKLIEQFSDSDYLNLVRFLENLPLFIELPEAILIHGLLEPGIPINHQKENILIGSMSGSIYMTKNYPKPWYEYDFGEKPIIAGHHDYSKEGKPLIINNKVFLIDTACCYGKNLSAILIPEMKIITVKSKKNYWGLAMQNKNDNNK